MNNFVKDLYKSISYNFLASLVGYSTFVLLAYLSAEEDFGRYLYLLALAALLSTFINFASEKVFSKVASNFGSVQKALNITFGLKTILLIFSILLFCIAFFFNISLDPFLLPFLITNLFINGIYEYKKQIKKLSIYILQERIIFLLLSVFLLNLFSFIFAISIAYILSSLYFLLRQFSDNKVEIKSFRFEPFSDYFGYVQTYLPVLLLMIAQLTYGYTSRLILEEKYGLVVFASISIAYQFINLFSIFQNRVDNFYRPKIIEAIKHKKSLKPIINLYFYSACLPVGIIAALLAVSSDLIIEIVFAGKFQMAATYLKFIAPLAISISLFRLQDSIFLALEKNNINLLIQTIFAFLIISTFLYDFRGFKPENYILIMVALQYAQVLISSFALMILKK